MMKVRSHAILKNLPRETQEQIAAWCRKANDRTDGGKPIPGTGGLTHAQRELAKKGIKVSVQTVSEFFTWWRDEVEPAMKEAQSLEERLRAGSATAVEVREGAEAFLMLEAVRTGNTKLFERMAKLQDSRRKIW